MSLNLSKNCTIIRLCVVHIRQLYIVSASAVQLTDIYASVSTNKSIFQPVLKPEMYSIARGKPIDVFIMF